MMDADVVVVGGGPAGSLTGLLLARHGLHVVLLERARFPRSKPCGDCLSPAANRILEGHGLLPAVLATHPARLAGWRLTSPSRVSFATRFAECTHDPALQFALAVEREKLDAVLLLAARGGGVEVVEQARVTDLLRDGERVVGVSAEVAGERREFRAALCIGADGLRSIVARRLDAYRRTPRLRKASFTMHVDLDRERTLGEMMVAPGACLGIAPVGEAGARHNLTLVLADGSFDGRGGVRSLVAEGLARFGFPMPDVETAEIHASGPFDWPTRRVVFEGAALVGDAAGYYDPFTGQGICQALAGAEQLAECAARAVGNRDTSARALGDYARAQLRLSRPARRVQQMIEFVCARPALCDRVFEKFSRDAALARALVAVTGDLAPPNSLFSPRLLMRFAI